MSVCQSQSFSSLFKHVRKDNNGIDVRTARRSSKYHEKMSNFQGDEDVVLNLYVSLIP